MNQYQSLQNPVEIPDLARFCAAFGDLGLKVGPRIGTNKRTQNDKEWFVVRNFLKGALRAGFFNAPFSVEKANPPQPDFILRFKNKNVIAYVEVTEATDPKDQNEMTKFELSKKSVMLLGESGGRFPDGASRPGIAWASDVIAALDRKIEKSICFPSAANRHLVIYPNSNASSLLSREDDDDDETERRALIYLDDALASKRDAYIQATNGCLVHILGGEYIFFDILGKLRLVER